MNLESTGIYIALAITVLIAIWAVYKTKGDTNTTSEYFTAFGFLDRKRIFFSVFATTFSAFTVVGLPAMFFAHGIGTFWFMWVGIALTPYTIRFIGKRIVNLSITITLGISIFLIVGDQFEPSMQKLGEMKLLETPGPKGYFTLPVLISYFVIFTLISVSTPQVSQKLMGIKDIKDLKPLTSWWFYPLIGSIVILLAGVFGFYAAANLNIASPDFVAGDVIRDISSKTSGLGSILFFLVATLFMSAVLSAAVSTIDSLLLAVSGIVSDNISNDDKGNKSKPKLKLLTILLLVGGLVFATQPPLFIVSLAQIQLAGLTALLPCLLGPLFGINSKFSGWLALSFGIIPVILIKFLNIPIIWGIDVGIIGLFCGLIGLFLGQIIAATKDATRNTRLAVVKHFENVQIHNTRFDFICVYKYLFTGALCKITTSENSKPKLSFQ